MPINPMNPDSVRPKPAIDVSENPSRDRRGEWLIAADYSTKKFNCIDTDAVASPTADRSDAPNRCWGDHEAKLEGSRGTVGARTDALAD
jgi:hypothetical protein